MILLLLFLYWIIYVVSVWKMYEKLGIPGWISVIPLYGAYRVFARLYGSGRRAFLLLIPGLNVYLFVAESMDLAEAFGRTSAFGFGLLFLRPVFSTILGYGSAVCVLPRGRGTVRRRVFSFPGGRWQRRRADSCPEK